MPVFLKKTVIQLLWFLGCLLFSFVMADITMNRVPGNAMLDISVQGRPVHPVLAFTLLYFIPVTFLVFLVKEWTRGFSRYFPSVVILVSGSLLIYIIGLIAVAVAENVEMLQIMLARSDASAISDETLNSFSKRKLPQSNFASAGILVQFIITICLLYVAYCRGKQVKPREKAEVGSVPVT